MAHIPSFEELLTEIHQGLGLKRDSRKAKFVSLGMELDKHVSMAGKLISEIFDALGMDRPACEDAVRNVEEFGQFYKAMELRTWTGNASQQQVVWHLLAYFYIPVLAHRLAFWTLHNAQNGLPALDAGMPGGKFWFLPNLDRGNDRIELPVTQVVAWLFDLLGAQSQESAVGGLQREVDGKTVNSNALRTLQGWYLEGRKSQSARKIEQLFSDYAQLDFKGAFQLNNSLSANDQFQAALAFVASKPLSAEKLQGEIPMAQERLEPILKGSAPEEEKQEFVRCIAERYAEPAMSIICRRLQVARMVQDGYERLLTFLCPGVEGDCTDSAKNKLLQLTNLFGFIYNLTIAAGRRGGSFEEQDAWFEAQLPPWDRTDLLLSICSSLEGKARCALLAERLTRKFMAFAPDSPLADLVPLDENNAGPIIERRLRLIQQHHEEDVRVEQLIERVRTASPWRALQAEDSYWVVSQFVIRKELTPRIQTMALNRMRDLAKTPGQKIAADVVELGHILDGAPDQWPLDVQRRVQSLLNDVQESPGYEEWKAPLLRFRAKHWLFQNDFGAASKDFDAALVACSERAFGNLRGDIARDAFATAIVINGFIPQNQERYYRNFLGYVEFSHGAPSFEDAATECEEFFWSDLYQPYPGFERQNGPAVIQFKAAFEETVHLIGKANWDGFREWMRQHAKEFRKKNLKDARRNSVLLQWLKVLHSLGGLLHPTFNENCRTAIRLLLDAWPEQAKIADFKDQTPLMLVADKGDVKLTRLLAPLSDVDAQDHLGRTALHAAVAGLSPECVAIVLERNPDVVLATVGEVNTALHTAVRFGAPESVRLIADEFPGLVSRLNAAKQTPLDMAHKILECFPDWCDFMRNKNRQTGSREDFEEIVVVLAQHC